MRLQLALSSFVCLYVSASPTKRATTGYSSKGMVAFGLLPSNARDSTGTTIGGIGSAIAIKRGTWARSADGKSYSGTFIVQPDRGYNVEGTVDYQARQHELAFTLLPYNGTTSLSFANAQKTLNLTYVSTKLYTERSGKATTGLDSLDVRPANGSDPIMPVPSVKNKNNLSMDSESLVLNSDGSFFVGEEYGAYIYKYNADGSLNFVIQPPAAVIPMINGAVNFTSQVDPDTGRAANAGFESLTASPDGTKLYAMLQGALMQDGADGEDDGGEDRYVRVFGWNISATTHTLTGEWVVPLPQTKKGKTITQNEIHYLDGSKFLVLSRDGHGNGDDTSTSNYKSIDYFDISGATNIAGSKYDTATTGVAPSGDLVSSVTPAVYTAFISMIDPVQLARFGLHNGGNFNSTLIDGKWESLALAPALDPANPDDYFLFTAADNDFITLDGTMVGQPYSSDYGSNVDNQFMVFLVTLPGLPAGSVAQSIA
ncbi:hypothetical protein FRB94_004975 [Tulasnella sp. JGI-2019a]|nr:hypothetical protein FRB94_004975 [Tulasnella sp. JGI-2019a]